MFTDVEAIQREAYAELMRRSLSRFFVAAWHIVEPTRQLLPSVAIEAMCAAGQAVAEGRIRRLAVSTCPGTSKSLFWSVVFPAWLELREHGKARIMVGSYAWAFALRDATRCRDLVLSSWYRGLVTSLGDSWEIREDANQKGDWWLTATGRRLITSIEGKSTGERCTWQIIDDALSAAQIFSAADKAEANRWVFEVLTTRLEDQRSDPRVIVGQRLCVGDPVAEAVKRGWSHLDLPAYLSVDEQGCELRDDAGQLVWRDSRASGVPIVELLDMPTLAKLRDELGSSTFNAQYLQKPSDDSSALFKRSYWNWYAPPGVPLTAMRPAGADIERDARPMPPAFDRLVITCDLTFGSKDGDYASIAAWGSAGPDRYLIRQWRDRAGFEMSKYEVKKVADMFPSAALCIENAAYGGPVIEELRRVLPAVKALRAWGKKVQRHAAAVPTVEAGNAWLPLGTGAFLEGETPVDASAFVEEHAGGTKHDDMIDCTAYAIIELNNGAMTREADGGSEITEQRRADEEFPAGLDAREIENLAVLI